MHRVGRAWRRGAAIGLMALVPWAVMGAAPERGDGKGKEQPFRWVNPVPAGQLPGVQHRTFKSRSMGIDVGYCIYLPPDYDKKSKAGKRYPVIYYLHGGRPGSEAKSANMARLIDPAIRERKTAPMIYVFPNGGKVSHYNHPPSDSMGEDVIVKELIPHIDATWSTIAKREGRGIEGFSQGGRGTTRIMFKYPELFCSASPGGSGYATEKKISESNGAESANLIFEPGYNTWDLARDYAARLREGKAPRLPILIHVGTKDFNYEGNLEFMRHLESLGIPYQKVIVEGATHSAAQVYEKGGLEIMGFHAKNFGVAGRF